MKNQLILDLLEENFAICQLGPHDPIPQWNRNSFFSSVTRTPEELSVICLEKDVPVKVKSDKNWRCLKINGILDFTLTGIISAITQPLADAGIGTFVLSTFNTDYFFVKNHNLSQTISTLKSVGFRFKKD
jgi:hypothetical protein